MATMEQANKINTDVVWLSTMTPTEKAQQVLDWCAKHAIHNNWTAEGLAAGMGHFPYWTQGPADFLSLVQASQELFEREHVICPNCKELFSLYQDGSIDGVIGA